jgi:CBS-domain-containing membrane protein
MSSGSRTRALRAVPLALALAMLSVVVLAGLLPDTGVVSATSNCTYGNCPASTPFPLWAVSAAVVVVVIALILALLLLRRNRRRPPAASTPPAGSSADEGPAAGAQDGTTGTESEDPSQQGWDEANPPSGPSTGAGDGEA